MGCLILENIAHVLSGILEHQVGTARMRIEEVGDIVNVGS